MHHPIWRIIYSHLRILISIFNLIDQVWVFIILPKKKKTVSSIDFNCPPNQGKPVEKQSWQNPRPNALHIKHNPLPSRKDKPSNNPGKADLPLVSAAFRPRSPTLSLASNTSAASVSCHSVTGFLLGTTSFLHSKYNYPSALQ